MRLADQTVSAVAMLGQLAIAIASCLLHGEAPTSKNLYQDTALRIFGVRWSPGRLLSW